jgi:hypothetical protein
VKSFDELVNLITADLRTGGNIGGDGMLSEEEVTLMLGTALSYTSVLKCSVKFSMTGDGADPMDVPAFCP